MSTELISEKGTPKVDDDDNKNYNDNDNGNDINRYNVYDDDDYNDNDYDNGNDNQFRKQYVKLAKSV